MITEAYLQRSIYLAIQCVKQTVKQTVGIIKLRTGVEFSVSDEVLSEHLDHVVAARLGTLEQFTDLLSRKSNELVLSNPLELYRAESVTVDIMLSARIGKNRIFFTAIMDFPIYFAPPVVNGNLLLPEALEAVIYTPEHMARVDEIVALTEAELRTTLSVMNPQFKS